MGVNRKGYLFVLFVLVCCFLHGQVLWYNPMNENVVPIYGRSWNNEIGKNYFRFPNRFADKVRKTVWDLSQYSAGLSIKFTTNSKNVFVKYKVLEALSFPHMSMTGVSGIDLYSEDTCGNQYWCVGKYQFGDTIVYTYNSLDKYETLNRNYCLYLPLYNKVDFLSIGVDEDCFFDFIYPSSNRPIVVYGTSIVQGACASRAGMAWSNILQRKINMPVINLGFSGNGLLEKELFDIMSEINASIYIIDCLPNVTEEIIQKGIEEGINILRSKSDVPILLVEHAGDMGYQMSSVREESFEKLNSKLCSVYSQMRTRYKNLYYLSFKDLQLTMDSQIDGCHPNDIGMQQYANAYCKKILQIMNTLKLD